jgi:subtilisin family serine protease
VGTDPQPHALPAWSLAPERTDAISLSVPWPPGVTAEWAWGGSTGAGVAVCVLDSGIAPDHPLVGDMAGSWAVTGPDTNRVEPTEPGDAFGHGTACAGIVRSLAPECELTSVRVLGADNKGSGRALITALRWAIENAFDVINLSLSTTRRHLAEALREQADQAYFGRAAIVCSAHNLAVESFPWRFPSVLSVASHGEEESMRFYANPEPPAEFFARGGNVDVAWPGGGTICATGNSFAAPHVSGLCALVLGKHPGLTVSQLKTLLHLTASNVTIG